MASENTVASRNMYTLGRPSADSPQSASRLEGLNLAVAPSPSPLPSDVPLPSAAVGATAALAAQAVNLDCPGEHGLKTFITIDSTFNCDACGASSIAEGSAMYGCRECDFDVCEACAKDGSDRAPASAGGFFSWLG